MGTIARLSAADLTNLATDHGSVPMQIGAVLVLDQGSAPTATQLVSVIEQRLARVPRLRERLRRPPFGCGRPYWEAVPGEVGSVVAVRPAPADEAGSIQAGVDEVLRRLPRDRPLCRAVVYADPTGRATAVVVVMHHVIADGIGGLAVLGELVDGAQPRSGGARPRSPSPSRRALARDAWTQRRTALRSAPTMLLELAAGLRELGGVPRQNADRSSLLQPTSHRRGGVDVVEVDLDALRAAGRARDATVNDLLLVAVGGALRRVLDARGERLDELVVSVPVSGRSSATTAELGNQVGVLPVAVPLSDDPAGRLAVVREQRARLGTTAPRASSSSVLSVLFRGLAALGVFQLFVRHQRLVHTFLTNLRGPTETLSVAGGRIRRVVPIATVPGNVTVTFGALSYARRLLVSVIYDPDHVPEHTLLRDTLRSELTQLIDTQRDGDSGLGREAGSGLGSPRH